MPTVSVVIPAYNATNFLEEALSSVYAQTRLPEEVVVVNDGSTDGTEQLLAELEGRLPDSFRWVTQPNGGEAAARNRGLAETSGDLVAFLDHDDLWHPTKLERQLAQLEDSNIGLSFTLCEGYPPAEWDPDPTVMIKCLGHSTVIGSPSAVVVKRAALALTPGFERPAAHGTDWLMWIRLTQAGVRFGHVPEPLTVHRWHGGNMSADQIGVWESVCCMFDQLPYRRPRARWHLVTAEGNRARGDRRRARHHIIAAARARPLSIRPGWLRLLF